MATILYIGNFARSSVGEPEVASSLEQCGHEVVRFQETATDIRKVIEEVKRTKYDLVLYCKLRIGAYDDIRFLQRTLKSMNIPYIAWLFDLYWSL